MNADLGFSATVYGLGGGLFFLSYALFEVPSNIFLARFGARRWIARIMVTWGLLAAGMMFVRTPMQFYVMRFLLGMAEAGFFPGVIYYLAHWFPRTHRGRAISRFYVSGSLATIVMGMLAGWLLSLDGSAGLRGWQWLFLLQGLPAVFIGLLVFLYLPDSIDSANWLTDAQRSWIKRELAADAARIGGGISHDLLSSLRDPIVLRLGLFGALTIGAFITFSLSAPLLLKEATGLSAQRIGWIVGLGGVLGAIGILIGGAISDRRGERFSTMLVSTSMVGVAYLAVALAPLPIAVVAAFLLFMLAWSSVTLANVMLWPDLLPLSKLAVGSAAINTMSQLGAFIMPVGWGMAKDVTGSYYLGLFGLAFAMLLALGIAVATQARLRAVDRGRLATL
jgi:ACS family tartrate transporter-like MFS transporter